MRSQSDRRLPKFPPMAVSGPPVQTNPLVWIPAQHGFPYWFKPAAFAGKLLTPFYSVRALAEALHDTNGAFQPPSKIDLGEGWECVELRARANPWHPSGRLEKLTVKKNVSTSPSGVEKDLQLTLKFHGDGEQIECVSLCTLLRNVKLGAVTGIVRDAKYKGPRAANDTKSAVSGNTRKRP